MPFSAKFSVAFQTEILSKETSDFLRQIIFLKSFSVMTILCDLGDNTEYCKVLTLKAPTTTAADDIHKYFFIVFQ